MKTHLEESLHSCLPLLFKPQTEVLQINVDLFASFCVSDETVRYAAILCLAKTHSRDEEANKDRSRKA